MTGPADDAHETDLLRAQETEQVYSTWQGVLHDEVAAALRAAATPGVGRLEVRRSARDALAAVEALGEGDDETDATADLVPALREVARAARTVVEVDAPDSLVVPASAAAAIVGAVAESVRNVERHAAGASARVLARRDGAQVVVQVVDDGPGFVVGTRPRPGGLGVSVDSRMVHAGGAAQVVSAPGQGATVTLVWPQAAGRGVRLVADAWRRGVREEAHARRRARLEEVVLPFLRRLAQDGAPGDDALRAQAALAEQAVRDEMHLPEALDAPTRALVSDARVHGCRVRVQSDCAPCAPSVQVSAVVSAAVTVALSVLPVPRELTLSVYCGHVDAPATVVVVTVPGSPARCDALRQAFADRTGAVVQSDDDATWAEIQVPG